MIPRFYDEFEQNVLRDLTTRRLFYSHKMRLNIKHKKQLEDSVSERSSCVYSDVFMTCTHEIQQVIQVYEAQYLYPKL